MDVQSFHLFQQLPPELRYYIYLLATPPRIVHVEEETEDRELFEEAFLTTPVQLRLHPSIAYFAHNWIRNHGRQAPWLPSTEPFSGQTTLEDYGFVSSKPKYQPWEPSAEVPEIPLNWLGENRNVNVAWAMTRRSELYSHAPIPALLHVCVESRASLMNLGYKLAFGTRTSAPMTWFHFGRDTLHVDCCYEDYENYSLLGGSQWRIGQFMPQDLKRVQRLSLKDGDIMLDALHWLRFPDCLRLMPNLRHLYLVDWRIVESEVPATDYLERVGAAECVKVMQGEPWSFLPVEEIDCFPGVQHAVAKLELDSFPSPPQSFGGRYYRNLKYFKKDFGPCSNFLNYNCTFLEAHFNRELKMEVPIKVSYVHLCDAVAATLIPIVRRKSKDDLIRRLHELGRARDLEGPRRDDQETTEELRAPYSLIDPPIPPPIQNETLWEIMNEEIMEYERTGRILFG